ncbi:MAG: ABC transporter permease, partial [Lachnospiraceae bacterium]|nr:ABC transporter permease [Lachnospiraceae bacterium]
TEQQINQRAQIGYAFAFITLGFLFCGVCVAHSVIEEQNNKVFTRVMLTKLSSKAYFISKLGVAVVICVMQTLVLAVCLSLIQGLDFGIGIMSFLGVIFLLGLIFGTLSLLLGVILGDVMSSNYAAFAIWSISALLAGLYFPLDDTTKALKTLSYLMPQKWFMDASELLLVGDKSAYSMLLCVTVSYLIVIISVGAVGLKVKYHKDGV